MKRYSEYEKLIQSGKLSEEEILVINEATLMRNTVELTKKKLVSQHDTIIIPLFDKEQNIIRRMGIFDKNKVERTDVDVAILKGQVYDERFLIIPIECDGAKLFEHESAAKPGKEEDNQDQKKLSEEQNKIQIQKQESGKDQAGKKDQAFRK